LGGGFLAACLAGRLIGGAGRLVIWLAIWLAGCAGGWLAIWLFGWLSDWLKGYLALDGFLRGSYSRMSCWTSGRR